MAYNTQQPNQFQGQPPGAFRQAPYSGWNGNQPIPIIRPVTSLEEVKASPIEFDGSVFFFTDIANKRIYTKQIGMDGTAIINLYEQKVLQMPNTDSASYVTKEEFEATIKQLLEKFNKGNSSEQAKKPLFEI